MAGQIKDLSERFDEDELLVVKNDPCLRTVEIEGIPDQSVDILESVDQELREEFLLVAARKKILTSSHESIGLAANEGEGWYGVFSFVDGYGICIEYDAMAKISA